MSAAPRRERVRPRSGGRLVVVVALALAASPVAAAEPPASPPSTKEQVLTLYNQGKELLDAGKTAEACQAFESAKRLDFTAINLILRLGDCYERLGRTASAYSQYQQAASIAAAAKDARQSTAEERVAAVAPLLARLAVAVAPGSTGAASVVVRRNGEIVVGEKLDGKPVPVDPGHYTFEAAATGKKTWTATREIVPGASVVVDVPALEAIVVA
ncbi:MAG: tetratricopeptide repeat protein, partial [Byssovorax sp.]